ncbi:NYN domain-containing protein [Candidatus Margulisiibacteriota bacterium]
MHYIIDGYNLLGKIRSISFSDTEKEQKLLAFLMKRKPKVKDHISLVFDGKNSDFPFGSKEKHGKNTIIFTPPDQTADDYIIELMQKATNKDNILIISSDNKIINAAKQHRLKYQKSETMIKLFRPLDKPSCDKEKLSVSEKDINYWMGQWG